MHTRYRPASMLERFDPDLVDDAQIAAASFLVRYNGRTLEAYRYDLRCFFQWAADADLDTLAPRLYVTIDDLLIEHPEWPPERPTVGITQKLSDVELITLAVIQALLGFTSEARFIRHAHQHLTPWFLYLPKRTGYNKRLRHAGELMRHVIAYLTRTCPSWHDDLWLVDSTPVECARSRETVKRSDLAGWAEYGY